MENLSSHIVDQFNSGSQKAFAEIYNHFYRSLYYFSKRLVADTQEAEDIVAESFIKLWKKQGSFASAENIKAFLFVITRNASLNYLRHSQHQHSTHQELSYLADDQDQLFHQEITAELIQLIYADIENLSEKRREIVKMILLEGLEDDQIASRLNISSKTVRNQKATAVQLLRTTHSNRAQTISFITTLLSMLFLNEP